MNFFLPTYFNYRAVFWLKSVCVRLTLHLKTKDIECQELGGLVVDFVQILRRRWILQRSAWERQHALGSAENPPGYMKGLSSSGAVCSSPGGRPG